MTAEELAAAEAQLAQRPEFAWLFEPGHGPWYQAAEVARGAGVARDTARDWCKDGKIPGAIYYGEDIGWKIPQSGLVEFFTSLQRRQHQAG